MCHVWVTVRDRYSDRVIVAAYESMRAKGMDRVTVAVEESTGNVMNI